MLAGKMIIKVIMSVTDRIKNRQTLQVGKMELMPKCLKRVFPNGQQRVTPLV